MRALVTGHSGFIGTHLRERLGLLDWEVLTVAGDVRHADLPPADVVFSLAAHVDVAASLRDPQFTIDNNVGISAALVDYARACDPLILHVTTAEAFGPGGPFGEWAPARPTNPYAASKAAQDAIFHAAAAAYGVRVSTVRTANVFGEHQPSSKFVPTVVRRILAGEPVQLFGCAKRRWIHADDVADALIRLAVMPPTTVNVTGADLVDNADIVDRIATRLHLPARVEVKADVRPGHEDVYDIVPSGVVADDLEAGLDRAVKHWSR